MTTVPLELVRVQIRTWPRTAWVLGVSQLGQTQLGGPGASWVDLLADGTSLAFARGGKVTGPRFGLDVGRLTLALVDAVDPLTWPYRAIPNLPVRVVTVAGEVIYTGRLEGLATSYVRDADGVQRLVVRLTVADAVKEAGSIPVTPAPVIAETFGERVDELMAAAPSLAYDPLPAWGGSAFVGVQMYDPPYPSLGGLYSWPDGLGGGLMPYVSPAGVHFVKAALHRTGQLTMTPFLSGVAYPLTGLTPGEAYTVTVPVFWQSLAWPPATSGTPNRPYEPDSDAWRTYALGVDVDGETRWGASRVLPEGDFGAGIWPVPTPENTLQVTFTATATDHTVRIAKDCAGVMGEDRPGVTWYEHSFYVHSVCLYTHDVDGLRPLEGTALAASLADHLDLAGSSAGVDWCIGQDGRVKFRIRSDGNVPTLTFSDQLNLAHINYLTLDGRYDTSEVINTLDITNHVVASGKAATAKYTVTNDTSVGLYGPRAGSLDTNLCPVYLPERAEEVMNATPDFVVETVTVNVLAYPALATLDLFTDVQVIFGTFTGVYQVVGVQHSLTPTTWRATITLRKEQ